MRLEEVPQPIPGVLRGFDIVRGPRIAEKAVPGAGIDLHLRGLAEILQGLSDSLHLFVGNEGVLIAEEQEGRTGEPRSQIEQPPDAAPVERRRRLQPRASTRS